ncbi:hypothetical protein SD81_036215 [Tolypothrix campylonemoides VB511288]|nr:hypothetical protein SD81_036215 [Tolypothrix campylonemoides VB511288]
MPYDEDNNFRRIAQEFSQLLVRYFSSLNSYGTLVRISQEKDKYLQEMGGDFWWKYGIVKGIKLYNLTIAQPIKRILKRLESSEIRLIIAENLQYIPWELMGELGTVGATVSVERLPEKEKPYKNKIPHNHIGL